MNQIQNLHLVSRSNSFSCSEDNGAIYCVRFSPNYQFLISSSNSGHLTYFDSRDGSILNRVSAHGDAANSITFLNENQFFTNSDDKTIKLWDVRQQQESVLCLRDQHTDWVKNVNIINQHTILTGAFDGRLVSWDLSKPVDDRSVKSRVIFSGGDRDSLIRDYQTDSLTRDHYMPRSHFFLRTAFNPYNELTLPKSRVQKWVCAKNSRTCIRPIDPVTNPNQF